MKLGNLVTFERHYIKAGNSFGPDFIDILPPDDRDKAYDEGVTLKKLIPKQEDAPVEGIVVGVRYLAIETNFEYMQYADQGFGPPPDRWESIPPDREKFYLVACNLATIRKVKPEDLKLKMVEDPIEGLMDE